MTSAPSFATSQLPLTVVMPAYDEAAGIAEAVREVRAAVFAVEPRAELLVVDDGSRDRTGAIARESAEGDPRIRVIERPNGGHGPALLTGLDAARGQRLLLLDSDRQIPLDDFASLWHEALGHDALLGVRRPRRDPPVRRALSAALRLAVRLLFGVALGDPNAPFKIVDAQRCRAARRRMTVDCPVPSLLLAIDLAACGCDVVERDVGHRRRPHGMSTLRGLRLARLCVRAGAALLAYRSALRRATDRGEAARAAGDRSRP